jgi:hypothetical protein
LLKKPLQENLARRDPKQLPIKIRNPKHEIRNKPQSNKPKTEENPNRRIPLTDVWNFVFFGHLILFRASDFVLRVCCSHSLAPFAPLREKFLFRFRFYSAKAQSLKKIRR